VILMNARRVGTLNQSSLRKDLIISTYHEDTKQGIRRILCALVVVTGYFYTNLIALMAFNPTLPRVMTP
jgi:hypothetical protein